MEQVIQYIQSLVINQYKYEVIKDEDGDTILHKKIIYEEYAEALEIVEKANMELLSAQNKESFTPLHLAVIAEHYDLVRTLLSTGVDREIQDHNGNTPLHIACIKGHMPIVTLLLMCLDQSNSENGLPRRNYQNMDICNFDGKPCVHLALENRHYNIVKLLLSYTDSIDVIERKRGKNILHMLCEKDYYNEDLFMFVITKIKFDKYARTRDNFNYMQFLFDSQLFSMRNCMWQLFYNE